jgi:histidinol-phosphate aminotransferase
MSLSRRELLSASALLLARPLAALPAPEAQAQAGHRAIVLCWNENPYGPSPAARLAVSRSIAEGCRYPSDAELEELVGELAHREGVSADCIVTGTGSGELLAALGLLCGADAGEIVAAEPTYGELPHYAQRRGATLRYVPVDATMRHDLEAMHAAVSERTRAVYVCNPNNPTGTTVPAAELRAFAAAMPASVITIVDEAYMDFTVGEGVGSVVDLTQSAHRVVVLRTFSKIHGMAGLRCGYGIMPPELAKSVAAARMATPNIFAVRAARASLGDTKFLADTRRRILASRTRITTELTRQGLKYAEPQGNFVFFDTGMPLARFTTLMKERNILVGRRFAPFENWCRITIGTESQVSAFIEALRAVTKA